MMKIRSMMTALASAVLLMLAGCDNFSITSRLILPDQLTLKAASSTAERSGSSVALTVTNGTAPYSFSVEPVSIYSGTALADPANPTDTEIGSVDTNPAYNPGTSIGRMKITVVDQEGEAAGYYITVGPVTPTLTSSNRGQIDIDTDYINLNWSYAGDTGVIDEFLLQRRGPGEESFTGILTVPVATYISWVASSKSPFFTDNTLSAGGTYTYRLYSVSSNSGEDFRSPPHDLVSAP